MSDQVNAMRPRIFTLNDPHAMRISAELAKEIGLNESIVLLQLEFLLCGKTEERDGRQWIYHTLEYFRETYFKWWSLATLSRIFKNLEKAGLIHIGNYNKAKYDRTQWVALNFDGLRKLESIHVSERTVAISQNEKSISQDERLDFSDCKIEDSKLQNVIFQNETTIQKDYKKTKKEEGETPALALAIADVCKVNPAVATRKQKAGLNETYAALKAIGATPDDVKARERWWYANDWRAKRESRPPRPEELREIWDMVKVSANGSAPVPRTVVAPKLERRPDAPPPQEVAARMLEKARAKRGPPDG